MSVTLRLLLLGVILIEVPCHFIIEHPFAGMSYFSNSNFQPAVSYSYIAPTGQTVNVKFASVFGSQPRPQISATPNSFRYHSQQAVFNSAPTSTVQPLPLSATLVGDTQEQFSISFQEAETPTTFSQGLVSSRPAGPPTPESLFVPATGAEIVASEKQIQAFNDYLKELAGENSGTTSTQSPSSSSSTTFSIEDFFDIDFGKIFGRTKI